VAVGVALLAATGWSQDALTPLVFQGGEVVIKPWSDSAYHAGLIRVFAHATGPVTLQEQRLAGIPLPFFYNHASFLWPAIYAKMTGVTGLQAFWGFMTPFGVFLTGLAAYVLAKYFFGAWPAVGAIMMLLLVPDASCYGMRNKWLSFFWLQQIAPASMYTVALLVLAWLWVFMGCQQRRVGWMLAGFGLAAAAAFFKAQLFVINAPLLWMYPILGYVGLTRMQRGWLTVACGAVLLMGLWVSRFLSGVPTLQLDDGSTRNFYVGFILQMVESPTWHTWLTASAMQGPVRQWLVGMLAVLGGTFGIGVLFCLALGFLLRRQPRLGQVWFPLTFVILYGGMALGLAFDQRSLGTPETLLHRPLIWAYFVLAIWNGGALCLILKNVAKRWLKTITIILTPFALIVPFVWGRGVQEGPVWGRDFTRQHVPVALFEAAQEIRHHSCPQDLVQDSKADMGLLAALADRQPYVDGPSYAYVGGPVYHSNPIFAVRQREIDRLNGRLTSREALAFFRRRDITWYLLRPETHPLWQNALSLYRVWERQGYRLYHFPEGGNKLEQMAPQTETGYKL